MIARRVELTKNALRLELGISDHNLICGCLVSKIRIPPPKIDEGRTFRRFKISSNLSVIWKTVLFLLISRWQLLGMGYHIQWHSWQARTETTSEDKRPVGFPGTLLTSSRKHCWNWNQAKRWNKLLTTKAPSTSLLCHNRVSKGRERAFKATFKKQ